MLDLIQRTKHIECIFENIPEDTNEKDLATQLLRENYIKINNLKHIETEKRLSKSGAIRNKETHKLIILSKGMFISFYYLDKFLIGNVRLNLKGSFLLRLGNNFKDTKIGENRYFQKKFVSKLKIM